MLKIRVWRKSLWRNLKENSIENQTGKSDVAEFDIKPEAKPKREKPEKTQERKSLSEKKNACHRY